MRKDFADRSAEFSFYTSPWRKPWTEGLLIRSDHARKIATRIPERILRWQSAGRIRDWVVRFSAKNLFCNRPRFEQAKDVIDERLAGKSQADFPSCLPLNPRKFLKNGSFRTTLPPEYFFRNFCKPFILDRLGSPSGLFYDRWRKGEMKAVKGLDWWCSDSAEAAVELLSGEY